MANPWNYINKKAKQVSHAVGGGDLVDYAGAKIAKARAKNSEKKYVADTTSAGKAAVSALKVAASVVPAGTAVKVARAAKATKATSTFKMGKKTVKVIDSSKVKRPKGNTVNKGNRWSDWGQN